MQRPLRFKPQRQPDVHPSFVAVEVPLPAFEFLAYMKSFFLLLPGKVKGAVGSPQAGSQVLKFAGQTHFQRQDVCFYCTFKTSCIKKIFWAQQNLGRYEKNWWALPRNAPRMLRVSFSKSSICFSSRKYWLRAKATQAWRLFLKASALQATSLVK